LRRGLNFAAAFSGWSPLVFHPLQELSAFVIHDVFIRPGALAKLRAAALLREQFRRCLIACATAWALCDVLNAANRDDGDDEEERDKTHALLEFEIRDRTATPAAHLLRRLARTPREEVCADDEEAVHTGLLMLSLTVCL